MGSLELLHTDLTSLEVDAWVNPWNRNVLPWFLLLPHGVSGAIRRRAGWRPFWALWRKGPIPAGEARVTTGGRGPASYLIHVAGLTGRWVATPESVKQSTDSAIKKAHALGCRTVAFPLIGAGVGGLSPEQSLELMFTYLHHAMPGFERLIVAVKEPDVFERAQRVWPKEIPPPPRQFQ